MVIIPPSWGLNPKRGARSPKHDLQRAVYAYMALAADHTRRMKLSTGVAIPSNRIERVTAYSIATINLPAPGRVIPRTEAASRGRYTMGVPPVPLKRIRTYVATVPPRAGA